MRTKTGKIDWLDETGERKIEKRLPDSNTVKRVILESPKQRFSGEIIMALSSSGADLMEAIRKAGGHITVHGSKNKPAIIADPSDNDQMVHMDKESPCEILHALSNARIGLVQGNVSSLLDDDTGYTNLTLFSDNNNGTDGHEPITDLTDKILDLSIRAGEGSNSIIITEKETKKEISFYIEINRKGSEFDIACMPNGKGAALSIKSMNKESPEYLSLAKAKTKFDALKALMALIKYGYFNKIMTYNFNQVK
ncbi:MAG: hypothetical protein PHS92_04760 [Candidatus Gracilibacteria bacterium]|nr:hypothetical protein [Candidatus Gracilibacteria bacterium]